MTAMFKALAEAVLYSAFMIFMIPIIMIFATHYAIVTLRYKEEKKCVTENA